MLPVLLVIIVGVIILIKLHLVWVLVLLIVGVGAGLRTGTWWAFWRLGEFERRQRHYRASRWRQGN